MIKRAITVMAALAACMSLAMPQPRVAADPPKVFAQVNDSLVYMQMTFAGTVRIPAKYMKSGEETWSPLAEIHGSCTGFIVDPRGYIGTAGHCVQIRQEIKDYLRHVALKTLSDANLLVAGHPSVSDMADVAAEEQWPVQGPAPESDVGRKVDIVQPERPNRQIEKFVAAQVVDYQNFDAGDNALLKVSGFQGLKPLEIAETTPEVGQPITSVGFPGIVEPLVDPKRLQQASYKSGTVSSHQVQDSGIPTLEISADVSPGMSGGPTVDENGRVVGVNSFGLAAESVAGLFGATEPGFNFVTDVEMLRLLLQKNGVSVAHPALQERSFPWLWIIVAVAAIIVAVLAAGLLQKPRWFGLTRKKTTTRRRRPRKRASTKPADEPDEEPAKAPVPEPTQPNGDSPSKRN
ncbi:MAG: hypothetical protein QOH60_2758 [Mycobacterium sp.]|jgi:V8-like Glu-specific endopeptidase|nr:hypothetical protein [Mycobacterium sp.]